MAEAIGLAGTVIGLSSIITKANKTRKWRKEEIPGALLNSPLGLITLHEPSQPIVDIVFVHGLQGHATRTWATSEVCWPKDLLPQDVPNARVLTFGYSALVRDETPLLIKDLGKTLLESLSINRRHTKAKSRPLVFVAHSLGGIVVKSALVYSRALDTVDRDCHQISKATCACVFFGTPHVKSGKASWAQVKSQISRALAAHSPSLSVIPASMLASAEAEDMLRLSSDFCHQSGQMKLVSCFETRATSTNRGKLLVVPKENVVMDMPNEDSIALNADHIEMARFVNKTDIGYYLIVSRILSIHISKPDRIAQFATHELNEERPAGIEDGYFTHGEDGADPVERERLFLSNLRSDWLDDVTIKDNTPGTCEWVLTSPVFQAWLSGLEKTLWIQGNPGAGKTVLAKFLYRQLCDAFAGDAVNSGTHRLQWSSSASRLPSRPRHVLAYFLDVNSPLRNSGLSVLHSLLYQILSAEPELFRYIHGKPIFSRPQQGDFGQYAEVLSAILRDPSLRETIIVLDALDECGPTSQLKIIDMLSALAEQSIIRLLVTSRPNEDFKPKFLLNLSQSEEHVELDIKKYVETSIRQLAVVLKFSEDLTDVITQKILARSSEGFLWVQLVLQSISKARTARMVRNKLEHLPQDLRRAYADSLNGTTGSTDVNMRRTLYFVMVAEAPLQVGDLSALLALSQCRDRPYKSAEEVTDRRPTSTAIGMSLDLVEIKENQTINFEQEFRNHFQPLLSLNENSVSLVHYSLREFLEMPCEIDKFNATFESQPQENRWSSDLRDVHGAMAALCLQYMLAAFLGHDDPLNFLDFACFHWTEHARQAGRCRSFHLEHLVKLLFLKDTDYASSWLNEVAKARAARVVLLPLKADVAFIFAAFDLGSHLGNLLGVSVESLQSTDQEKRTPLHLAAANNSLSSVRWIQTVLSVAGKDIGDLATMEDSKGESPISLAAQNGHAEVMRLLLTSIKTEYRFDSRLFKTIGDSGNIGMFETLYGYTNIKNPHQGTSLLTDAAKLDSVSLMERIFLDHGGSDNMQHTFAALRDSNGNPLLHIALLRQSFQVLKYLLDKGYPPAVTDRNGNTALHIAAQEGRERVAGDLIEAGVPVNSINNGGETPLHIASKIGLPVIVRLLCNNGANVSLAGSSGCLPAHLAAETGQEELINILIQFGTNINATDNTGRSALHIAAGAGQESTLTALLRSGADVNVRDDEGMTPVHYAVQSGDLRILYMLCEAGADLSASDDSNITPLHLAARHGSEILVRELIRLGTEPNPRDSENRTPLHYSCLSKRSTVAVVKTLLGAGADVSALDGRSISPIHLAAEQGFETVVRALANYNADIKCQDLNGRTPLHYGCRSERSTFPAVRYLLETGADVSSLDRSGLSPLHHACLSGSTKEEVIRSLLDFGVDVNQPTYDGVWPLHYAIEKGNPAIIKLLCDQGAINLTDGIKRSIFLAGNRAGNLEDYGFGF